MNHCVRKTLLAAAFAAGSAFTTLPAQASVTPVFEYSFPSSYDASDTVVTDLSGAGNDATMDLTGALVDDRPAGFDSSLMSLTGSNGGHGVTNAIDLLNNADVAAAGGFTMDVWFNWGGNFTDVRKLIDYAGTEHLSTIGSQLRFAVSETFTLTFDIQADTWYHAVGVFDSEGNALNGDGSLDGTMYLYVDDVLVGSTAATKTTFGDSLDRPIGINRWPGGPGADWNQGAIFNPAVYLGAVPEPGSLALLALGGLMIARRRRA